MCRVMLGILPPKGKELPNNLTHINVRNFAAGMEKQTGKVL